MLKVGLIDIDMFHAPKKHILNIDLMKFGAYYEKNDCQVETMTPEDSVYDYDKVVVFSNYYKLKNKELREFERHPNISYYGLAFSHFEYIPTYIKEIDYADYSTKYYHRLFSYYYKIGKYSKEEIQKMEKLVWARVLPNKDPINISKLLTGERIMIADSRVVSYSNWDEVFSQLRIYNRYVKFTSPQRVTTQEEFDNFKKLFSYNFVNCQMLLDTYDMDNFKNLINNNYDWIKDNMTKISYGFGNDINNRKEEFYREDFDMSFQKILFLKEKKIRVTKSTMLYSSNRPLTFAFYKGFNLWCKDSVNTKKNFHQAFIQANRKDDDIIKMYFSFLNRNPSYYHLLNKKLKKED
jgi:hypothetical protein